MGKQCRYCKFAFLNDVSTRVECRKNPPKAGKDGIAVFPQVESNFWCGSFREKGAPING